MTYWTYLCCEHCDLDDDYHGGTYADNHDDECADCEA